MLEINPFSVLSETIPTIIMQGFIIAMIFLIAAGTIIQMINHKNLTYFLNNAKKQNCRQQERQELQKKQKSLQRQQFMISEPRLSQVLEKEDLLMSLGCMGLSYFGFHQQYQYFAIQVQTNLILHYGQCYGTQVLSLLVLVDFGFGFF